jgi:hypothetical protein
MWEVDNKLLVGTGRVQAVTAGSGEGIQMHSERGSKAGDHLWSLALIVSDLSESSGET